MKLLNAKQALIFQAFWPNITLSIISQLILDPAFFRSEWRYVLLTGAPGWPRQLIEWFSEEELDLKPEVSKGHDCRRRTWDRKFNYCIQVPRAEAGWRQ